MGRVLFARCSKQDQEHPLPASPCAVRKGRRQAALYYLSFNASTWIRNGTSILNP